MFNDELVISSAFWFDWHANAIKSMGDPERTK
jgi:hypothetical protein